MEFRDYDFIRIPIVQNQVFFLESECAFCGFSVLTRSIEELIEHEKLHRTQCSRSNAAAQLAKHERRYVELQNCEDTHTAHDDHPDACREPR